MTNLVGDFTLSHWSTGAKVRKNSSGWMTRNAPCCAHRGEKADTRQRGGLIMSGDGAIAYHCFNCKFKASYTPGHTLSRNFKQFLEWLGANTDEIKKLDFTLWLNKDQDGIETSFVERKPVWVPRFDAKFLPKGAKTFDWWAENEPDNKHFIDAASYLMDRDPGLLTKHTYYLTVDEKQKAFRSIIIPFRFKGQTVGWTGRAFDADAKTRYNGEAQLNYLFNADVMYDESREFILIVEGVFDAINLNCVAALGSSINQDQADWINSFGKRVIIVPDQDHAGIGMIDAALTYGWSVSLPETSGPYKTWDSSIKDISAAVSKYGTLYTLSTIMDSVTDDKLQIELRRSYL